MFLVKNNLGQIVHDEGRAQRKKLADIADQQTILRQRNKINMRYAALNTPELADFNGETVSTTPAQRDNATRLREAGVPDLDQQSITSFPKVNTNIVPTASVVVPVVAQPPVAASQPLVASQPPASSSSQALSNLEVVLMNHQFRTAQGVLKNNTGRIATLDLVFENSIHAPPPGYDQSTVGRRQAADAAVKFNRDIDTALKKLGIADKLTYYPKGVGNKTYQRAIQRAAVTGSGMKKQSSKDTQDIDRLQVVLGSLSAGNTSKMLKTEAMGLIDNLLINKKISKIAHKQLFKEINP